MVFRRGTHLLRASWRRRVRGTGSLFLNDPAAAEIYTGSLPDGHRVYVASWLLGLLGGRAAVFLLGGLGLLASWLNSNLQIQSGAASAPRRPLSKRNVVAAPKEM